MSSKSAGERNSSKWGTNAFDFCTNMLWSMQHASTAKSIVSYQK